MCNRVQLLEYCIYAVCTCVSGRNILYMYCSGCESTTDRFFPNVKSLYTSLLEHSTGHDVND